MPVGHIHDEVGHGCVRPRKQLRKVLRELLFHLRHIGTRRTVNKSRICKQEAYRILETPKPFRLLYKVHFGRKFCFHKFQNSSLAHVQVRKHVPRQIIPSLSAIRKIPVEAPVHQAKNMSGTMTSSEDGVNNF